MIKGFDENYEHGYSYDDDDLLLQIKYNLKLNTKIVNPDECFVIHQFHTRSKYNNDISQKLRINEALFVSKKDYFIKNKFDYPRLLHLYWDGSNFSFLNLITILSFNKYHKYWKIIIHMPINKTQNVSWHTPEQKLKYNGKDYFSYIQKIKNVVINKIDFKEIGFNNQAPEIIKSDYLRYYVLMKYGGVWSDFDIIFVKNIEEQIRSEKESILFFNNRSDGKYFPVAFFISKPNNSFFKFIIQNVNRFYNPISYQCLGTIVFSNLFLINNQINLQDFDADLLEAECYLPLDRTKINVFLSNEQVTLPDHVFGIHWFNGSNDIKNYINQLDKRIISNTFTKENYLDSFVSEYLHYINL
jgi:hypothetical protein